MACQRTFGRNLLRVLSAEDGNCEEEQQNGVGVSLHDYCHNCGSYNGGDEE